MNYRQRVEANQYSSFDLRSGLLPYTPFCEDPSRLSHHQPTCVYLRRHCWLTKLCCDTVWHSLPTFLSAKPAAPEQTQCGLISHSGGKVFHEIHSPTLLLTTGWVLPTEWRYPDGIKKSFLQKCEFELLGVNMVFSFCVVGDVLHMKGTEPKENGMGYLAAKMLTVSGRTVQ